MAANATPDRPVASAWPALAALAVVAALSIGMLAVDLVIDRKTAAETAALVDDSLRSVALADDLRYQAHRLSHPGLDDHELASIARDVAWDARAYEPLADDPGEDTEWRRLQALLAHLQHDRAGASVTLVEDVEASIARLVAINQESARTSRDVIRRAHEHGLVADAIVGAITLALALAVAIVLVRALRRQRGLLALHLAGLAERERELETFAARTSHDLKGPLSPLRGYADVLTMHAAPEVRELGVRIRRASDRMAGVVDDLLAISVDGRPRAGSVRVGAVVREVVDDLGGELAGADVVIAAPDLAVACSAGVLAQILRNVIGNAAKYRAAERALALRLAAHADGTGMVAITIADNGAGMDAAAVERAFEPGFRGAAASGAAAGHGLGLAIVKRAVDSVGGTVALTSTPGVGTRVTLRLPAA